METRSRNLCFRGKSISIKYSDSVFVALVTQHVKRVRRIELSIACLTVPYFYALSHMARVAEKYYRINL
jgi:hypothetical protein